MKKIIGLLLVLVMVLSLSVSAFGATISYTDKDGREQKISDFRDTAGHWAHDTILKCADYGWVQGDNGNFMPNKNITRGDLCVVLDRMLGLSSIAYNYFTDLPDNIYYRDSVLRCVSMGYVQGTSDTTVSPRGYATREQVAVIICRMFDLDTSNTKNIRRFADDYNIGSWARDSVYTMRKYGYMNGNGNNMFNPKSNITRAELITVLSNIAGTYIPKKDTEGYGSSFRNDFAQNLMVARKIDLSSSTIGRDLILTQTCNGVNLSNVVVNGRLFVMGKATVSLSKCEVSQVYLSDGKSNVSGIDNGIEEVYVAEGASESSLDSIPNKLVLEAGTRVKVNGTMYENDTNKVKTFEGMTLKANIADEQGYIVGGPRVLGSSFVQEKDNSISVKDIRISVGEARVTEVGVVWLQQAENKDVVNPTYQNCDGKVKYNSSKIGESFGFSVGNVKGYCAYRVYVKDSDGLFAYGTTKVFSAYDYDISLKIYDNAYPEKIDAEVVFSGRNIPEISSVRVVYDIDSLYRENHEEVSLSLYKAKDTETEIDLSKYKRYIGTIYSYSEKDKATGVVTYTPPTDFGYIIMFKDGSVLNKFPVLTNALPEDVAPTSLLETGTANFVSDGLLISNNKLVSRYIAVQEMGIVYKVSSNRTTEKITADVDGWTRVKSGNGASIDSSLSYNVKISDIDDMVKGTYTKYAAYIKTSNGYWYSNMKVIANDYQADENGYEISSVNVKMLGDADALVSVELLKSYSELSKNDFVCLGEALGVSTIEAKEGKINGRMVYFVLRGLSSDKVYNIPLRLEKVHGEKSNVFNVSINTSEKVQLAFGEKATVGKNTVFILGSNQLEKGSYKLTNAEMVGSTSSVYVETVNKLLVPSSIDTAKKRVKISYTYYASNAVGNTIGWSFDRTLSLY